MNYLTKLILVFAFAISPISISKAQTKKVSFKGEPIYNGTKVYTLPGLLTKPKGKGPFPAVIILPHCGGVRISNVSKIWPNYLRKLGYVTLAVDNLKPRRLKHCNRELVHNNFSLTQDAMGALKYLSKLSYVDKGNIAAIGFSMGGFTMGYIASENPTTKKGLKLKAGVSMYGNCTYLLNNPTMPLLVINAEKERFMRRCQKKSEQLSNVTFHVMPGAYHAFDQSQIKKIKKDIGGNKMLYNAKATQKSRELIKDFLAQHLK